LDILAANLSLTIIGLVMISTNSWIYKASFTKNPIASLKKFPPLNTHGNIFRAMQRCSSVYSIELMTIEFLMILILL
jgi:hypothetical protein